MRESKSELTDRLRREGRWDAFKKRREELKAAGTPAKQAWIQAAAEFPPENPLRAIEPCIEWEDAKAAVEGAKNDFEWLLAAMYVKLPPGVGNPGLLGQLQRMRTNPALADDFYRLAARRHAEQAAIPPPPEERRSIWDIVEEAQRLRDPNREQPT